MSFDNQTAVITGGAQGIGKAVAQALAKGGAQIAIWDMDLDIAKQSAKELGRDSFAIEVDISDWASVQDATTETVKRVGKIDILVNSAGIAGPNSTLEDYDVADFAKVIQINLMGTFYVNKAIVPIMRTNKYGRIVNVASIAGKEGNPNASAYSSSKAGVIGLTKSLGKELAKEDIAVNCVTPAAARTRIFDQMKQEHIDYMLSKIPRGRFLETDEAACMIAWLCSRGNSFTTGGIFDLSGGRATY